MIKVWKNRSDINFSNATTAPPVQTFELIEDCFETLPEYRTKLLLILFLYLLFILFILIYYLLLNFIHLIYCYYYYYYLQIIILIPMKIKI